MRGWAATAFGVERDHDNHQHPSQHVTNPSYHWKIDCHVDYFLGQIKLVLNKDKNYSLNDSFELLMASIKCPTILGFVESPNFMFPPKNIKLVFDDGVGFKT